MTNRGDMNMARQLQAEFDKPKLAKQRGRRSGSGNRGGSYQASSDNQYQYQQQQSSYQSNYATFDRGGGGGRGRGGGGGGNHGRYQASSEDQYQDQHELQPNRRSSYSSFDRGGGQYRGEGRGRGRGPNEGPATVSSPSVRHPRPVWQGQLVTNDSSGADQFFYQPQRPLPSTPATFSQATAPSPSAVQQPGGQQPGSLNGTGTFTFRQPLEQTTNQISPQEPPNTGAPVFAVTTQQEEFPHAKQEEDQEDVEMSGVDSQSTVAPNSAPTPASKRPGLAASRWNPENAMCNSGNNKAENRQAPLAENPTIVKSGISQGFGLEVSR